MAEQPVHDVQQQDNQQVTPHTDKQTTASNIVWYLFSFIAVLLAFRFALKLFGANPSNAFVEFIYNVSKVFTAPFDSIFGVTTSKAGEVTAVFEPSILVAIAVYAVVAWGVTRLITINQAK